MQTVNFKRSSLFNEKKAAQVAAFFLFKGLQRHANITLLKLMKLMYLAERDSYKQYGEPIIGDALVSMPNGPVLSTTLDLINFGSSTNIVGGWDSLIAERSGRDMTLKRADAIRSEEDLRELSDSDIEILHSIWNDFGSKSAIWLREFTHDPANCPEWEDPDGSSVPIDMDKLFLSFGLSEVECKSLHLRLDQRAWIASTLSIK